jgi:uncharacterized protein YcfJ
MKKFIAITSLATTLLLSSSFVFAGDHFHHRQADTHQKMAKVTSVQPIYRNNHASHQYQNHSNHRNYNSRTHSLTSTIAGGIIGGVAGHQFGKGSGNTVMTLAGTVLGGSIGHDYHQNNHSSHQDNARHTKHRTSPVAYHVTYRYKGHSYQTKMAQKPGRYIPVNIEVTPARHSYYR